MSKNAAMLPPVLSVLALVGLIGCPGPQSLTTAAAVAAAPKGPCGPVELKKVTALLPGGGASSSTVRVEKVAPEEVLTDHPFEYQITVENLAKVDLKDVTVWDAVPVNLKINKASPNTSSVQDGTAVWKLGDMRPGAKQTLVVEAVASSTAPLKPCTEVTYRMTPVCLAIHVVEQKLVLTKTAPSQVMPCDPIPVKVVAQNTGTAALCSLVLRDRLPDGLTTGDGRKELVFTAGTLLPGQTREFTASIKADRAGEFTTRTVATGDAGLIVESNPTTIKVIVPELTVETTGPEKRYVGRPIAYAIKVSNSQAALAKGAVLINTIPPGATFVSADGGGRHVGDTVVWDLGDLKPGDSRQVGLTLRSDVIGTIVSNTASVKAYCASASGGATTLIQGIPAILLECSDVSDPVEIGAKETYVITVTNTGSAADTNIVVKATLPPEEKFVSADGATKETVEGQVVTFAPLRSLGPKEKAVYRVVVKAQEAGDVRFKVALTSDQLATPAEKSEATTLYK